MTHHPRSSHRLRGPSPVRRSLAAASTVALSLLVLLPAVLSAERFSVPLSDPSRPPVVEASLTWGEITVRGHEGAEVVVETDVDEEEIEADERYDGLRRIPNTSLGFTIEEEDNRVRLTSSGFPQASDVVLLVPWRSSLSLKTVNGGDLVIEGVHGELDLTNTNGSIEALDVGGTVIAHSVNGDVTVRLLEATPGEPMSFTTLNGDLDLTLPPDLVATFEIRTDFGEILTDFDVDLERLDPRVDEEIAEGRRRIEIRREVRAKLNGGGPAFELRTLHGDVYIRKGD